MLFSLRISLLGTLVINNNNTQSLLRNVYLQTKQHLIKSFTQELVISLKTQIMIFL